MGSVRCGSQSVSVDVVSGECVFFQDDAFGRGIGGIISSDASVGAYLSECGGLVVVVAGAYEVDDGVEEGFVGGVVSFSRAG